MRKVTKTDQEKAEIEAAERQDRRKGGFGLMKDRDQGYAKLHDLDGSEVTFLWYIDKANRDPGLAYMNIPDNCFGLVIRGELSVFDAEEFRRLLRWA